MKVLVVDDDVVSRMVLMHLIDSCGSFDIVEAEDGADAWDQLDNGLSPSICFCDLRMPRLSGIELLQRIKGDARLSAIPFVLVTSATDRATVQHATQAGAAGYIVKPFEAEQVREQLSQLGAGAASEAAAPAEAPREVRQRLGISGERLLVYLNGFQAQLNAADEDAGALLARKTPGELAALLERLRTGCVTLGLHGAAALLDGVDAGTADGAALHAALAGVLRSVARQSMLVRQDNAAN